MKAMSLERLGRPGVIGLGLILFSLSFYLGSIAPAEDELARLKQEEKQLLAAARAAGAGEAGRPLPREPLPALEAFPALLKELNVLAERRGVAIERASYALTDVEGQRRMEIELPLKAPYPSLRAYLHDVLALRSSPSLDELSLQRRQSSDPLVEANVRLSYRVGPAP